MEYNLVDTIMMLNEQCCHLKSAGGEENNLTSKELQVILSLDEEETVNGGELARRNVLSPSRMSRIIDRLASRGLLRRETDENDRRLSRLYLTGEGAAINKQVSEFRKQCELKIKSRLSDHEFAVIQKALKLLTFAMENEYGINDGPSEHHQ